MMNEQMMQNNQGINVKNSKLSNSQQKKQEELDIVKKQLRDMTDNYISFIRRVRILEEKFNNLQRKISLMDKVSLDNHKENKNIISDMNTEIYNMQRGIGKINDNMHIIVSDLKETAKVNDLEELEKYIEVWEPCNFVTSNDVNSIVKRIVEKSLEDVHLKLQEEDNLKKIAANIFKSKESYFIEIIREMLVDNNYIKENKIKKEDKNNQISNKNNDENDNKNSSNLSVSQKRRKDIWNE